VILQENACSYSDRAYGQYFEDQFAFLSVY
jgi:hypothetical protein